MRRKGWGGVADRGAVREERNESRGPWGREVGDGAPPEREGERWVDEGPVGDESTRRDERRSRRAEPPVPVHVDREELARFVEPHRLDRVATRVRDAARAFEGERFEEARRLLDPVVKEAPDAAGVRELRGLVLYRLGRWQAAIDDLEVFRGGTGSTEQHPVLADCRRALGQFEQVEELWDELRRDSPSAALVTEGRIVMAGAMADRDDLAGAIRLLEKGFRAPQRPQDHHLRRMYVLADLYERAGEIPKARSLFGRIAAVDRRFADVQQRLRL